MKTEFLWILMSGALIAMCGQSTRAEGKETQNFHCYEKVNSQPVNVVWKGWPDRLTVNGVLMDQVRVTPEISGGIIRRYSIQDTSRMATIHVSPMEYELEINMLDGVYALNVTCMKLPVLPKKKIVEPLSR